VPSPAARTTRVSGELPGDAASRTSQPLPVGSFSLELEQELNPETITGLRPQEAMALSWTHVRDRTLLIEQRVVDGAIRRSTKTRQNRTVRLLAPVVRELKELRMWQRRPGTEALLFAGPGGRPWNESTLGNWKRRAFAPAKAAAGAPEATPYTLRHSFCVAADLGGAPDHLRRRAAGSLAGDDAPHLRARLRGVRGTSIARPPRRQSSARVGSLYLLSTFWSSALETSVRKLPAN
jgi:integrase